MLEDGKRPTDDFFLRTVVWETEGSPQINCSAITFSGSNTDLLKYGYVSNINTQLRQTKTL